MQAITVKYLPTTDTRGARIKARAKAGSVTISYPYEAVSPFRAAAEALCQQLGGAERGWDSSRLIEGTLPNGDTVFVLAPR